MRFASGARRTRDGSTHSGLGAVDFLAIALGAAGVLLVASTAAAAGADPSNARARYQEERAACMIGRSRQDRATCLREAGAALQEARRGRLGEADPRQYEENRLTRCNPLPPDDREDCVRRMRGEGITKGSVGEGGLYRELTRPAAPRQAD